MCSKGMCVGVQWTTGVPVMVKFMCQLVSAVVPDIGSNTLDVSGRMFSDEINV